MRLVDQRGSVYCLSYEKAVSMPLMWSEGGKTPAKLNVQEKARALLPCFQTDISCCESESDMDIYGFLASPTRTQANQKVAIAMYDVYNAKQGVLSSLLFGTEFIGVKIWTRSLIFWILIKYRIICLRALA